MGFGKWLRGATRIRFDDRTLSNLTRNAAIAGGTLIGGPAGLAIAGGGSALGRGLAKGANFGNIVRAGLSGAATSGALRAGTGLLRSAAGRLGGGSAAGSASGAAPGAVPSAVAPTVPTTGTMPPISPGAGGVPASVVGAPTTSAATIADAAKSANPGILRSALSFTRDNPSAVGMGLQAVGNLTTSGSENRLNNANADLLEQRYGTTEEERRRRQAVDDWFKRNPLTLARAPIAANPYAPAGA